jgi:hypothetical protein
MEDSRFRAFCEWIIMVELVKSPTTSLRGAKRRGNLLNIRLDTRLLRFARNDKWDVFRLFTKPSLLTFRQLDLAVRIEYFREI